jgi:hypothetical protein
MGYNDPMSHASIRFWFCIAVAVIAAAFADPLVEAASNAGWFGPGNFTDHSNLDVLPALLLGSIFVFLTVSLRVRRELMRATGLALGANLAPLLPTAFAAQIAVLFSMETLEQLVVTGRPLGGMVWIGGPVWFSLAAHAVTCAAVAFTLARAVCACARTTVRVIRQIRELAQRLLLAAPPLAARREDVPFFLLCAPVVCRIGNRAPPALLA